MKPPVNKISISTSKKTSDRTGLSLALALMCVAVSGAILWAHQYRPQLLLMSSTDVHLALLFLGGSVLYVVWWLLASNAPAGKQRSSL